MLPWLGPWYAAHPNLDAAVTSHGMAKANVSSHCGNFFQQGFLIGWRVTCTLHNQSHDWQNVLTKKVKLQELHYVKLWLENK